MKRIVRVALSVSLAFGPIAPVLADVTCVPVEGKALNNSLNANTTLGVASVIFGEKGTEKKFKCALWGTKLTDVPLTFQHVLSCDDELSSPIDGRPVHSRVVLSTTGAFTGGGADFLTFAETSVPVLNTGGGYFFNATGGSLRVTGIVFLNTGAIDMKFGGNICYGS